MGEWQPIETAPKDGTEFLAWVPHWLPEHGGRYLGDCKWDAGGGWVSELYGMCHPTHWMPLPNPPGVKE